LPDAIIVAYAQDRGPGWFARCSAAGATLVVDKASPEGDIRERLRSTVALHTAGVLVAKRLAARGKFASE